MCSWTFLHLSASNSHETALQCTGLRHSEIICFIARQRDFFYVAVNTINLQQFHLRKHFLQKTQWLIVDLQVLHWKDVFASVSSNSAAIPARNRPLSLKGVSHHRATGTACVRSVSKDLACSTERSCFLRKISSQAQCSDATVKRDFLKHTIPNSHWHQNLGYPESWLSLVVLNNTRGTNVFCNLPTSSCIMCIPGIQQKWRQEGAHPSPARLP